MVVNVTRAQIQGTFVLHARSPRPMPIPQRGRKRTSKRRRTVYTTCGIHCREFEASAQNGRPTPSWQNFVPDGDKEEGGCRAAYVSVMSSQEDGVLREWAGGTQEKDTGGVYWDEVWRSGRMLP